MIDLSLMVSLQTVVIAKGAASSVFLTWMWPPLLIVILQFVYYNGRNRL
ncbi:Hypothetical protein BSM4216_1056 [Bacillus smithii]|nr:Hypothetical protein BSM4216_1056 [Bacillus smithii]